MYNPICFYRRTCYNKSGNKIYVVGQKCMQERGSKNGDSKIRTGDSSRTKRNIR